MTSRPPTTTLAIVGRSSSRQPRTYRLEGRPMEPQRGAAYRRLAAAMLGLDVASLAATLRSARLGTTEDKPLAA